MKDTIEINGEQYRKVNPKGNRAVIVMDRGWIYAGDVEEIDDRIYLTRVAWVFKWSAVGFAAIIEDPSNADIRECADINLPADVELFRVPVSDDWGIK